MNGTKKNKVILLSHIIISWYIQSLEKMFVLLVKLPVRVQIVLLDLINIGCQIVYCYLNQYMIMLKNITIKKYLYITMIELSWDLR